MAYNATLVSTNADNFPSNVAIQGFPRLSTFDHSSVLLARPSATVQLADPSCEACLIFSSQSHLSRLWLPWKNPSIAQTNPRLAKPPPRLLQDLTRAACRVCATIGNIYMIWSNGLFGTLHADKKRGGIETLHLAAS